MDVNLSCGTEPKNSVAPILQRLYENAVANSARKTKQGNRHDTIVKKFACSLYCMIGRGGYELLFNNLGCALPCLRTVQLEIASKKRINEGEFQFDGLLQHLKEWQSVLYVHIQLDDTRTLHKIEYDAKTNRFLGFCLPLRDGLPICDVFILNTFEEIKKAVEENEATKYAHCIVAQPVDGIAPPTVLFILGTDSKYNHETIIQRWNYITKQLWLRGIKAISFGADGAGAFMKAMIHESRIFQRSLLDSDIGEWSFFRIRSLKNDCLYNQDTVHLLAKLRNKLLTPSNLIVIGNEVACPTHLQRLVDDVPKSRHGLTRRAIDQKDKQNYRSIELLIDSKVEICLLELNQQFRTKGTIHYLSLMRNIREAMFNKSLPPLRRIYYMWVTVFFLRIWRTWLLLNKNLYNESDHFITQNSYLCIELNAHMILNTVVNVIKGILPKDALRFWLAGSQACEQTFRLLRAMTPTFSTIINFTIKGVLERIHKLSYLAACESSQDIIFPRVQRRLLQLKCESTETFTLPSIPEIFNTVQIAKEDAKGLCKDCGISLDCYNDDYIVQETEKTIEIAENDHEIQDFTEIENFSQSSMSQVECVLIQEDMAQIKLKKAAKSGLPTYNEKRKNEDKMSKTYRLVQSGFTAFVKYENAYIRKSTALYLLQENCQVSNDRLLRVRRDQPSHLFSVPDTSTGFVRSSVQSGDLCIFRRIDNKKYLIGRVIQFSYLDGSKRDRQYTSTYVDMTKDSHKSIGMFANWYIGVYSDSLHATQVLLFKPLDGLFTIGYLSMEQYVSTINDDSLSSVDDFSFGISYNEISKILPHWFEQLTIEKL